jgi:hypothetical protein
MIPRRTVNIARRRSWVQWVVIALFTIITALEWFTNMYHRDREFRFLWGLVKVLNNTCPSSHHQCKCLCPYTGIQKGWYWCDFLMTGQLLGRQLRLSSICVGLLPAVNAVWSCDSVYLNCVLVQIEHPRQNILPIAQNVSGFMCIYLMSSLRHHSMLYDGLGYFAVLTGKDNCRESCTHLQMSCSFEYSQHNIISNEQPRSSGLWSCCIFFHHV